MSSQKSSGTFQENLMAHAAHLQTAAEKALAYASKKGADKAKVAVSASIERRLMIENKEFALANSLETQKVGILVHKDQKKGSANLNNVDIKRIESSVDDALTLARFSVPDEHLVMPHKNEAPKAKPLNFLFDSDLCEMELGRVQEFASTVLSRLTKDSRVALDKCEVSVSLSWHGMYNSLGMAQSERQTALGWSFFGMAVDRDEVSGFDYDGRHAYTEKGALDLALADADRFCEKVLSNLRPIKSPTYKGLILLTPRAVEEILLGTIFYHAAGSSVMDGKSQWAKSVGKQVISDKITMIDRPHDQRFTGATSFDSDGLPTRDTDIIVNGVLNCHLLDCYSARRIGTKSNAMSGGPFALEVKGGNGDLNSMKNARNDLLVVDRFSGNIDPVKGDFSGVAKSSRLLKNGKDVGAVTETMIAGNIFELLQSIQSISKDQELISGAMLAPWILVDHVSVSGGG